MSDPNTWPEPTEESRFTSWADHGSNLLLTGSAGTGKTTLMRSYIAANQAKVLAVTASTGIAALNIGGSTVHRWAGVQIGPATHEDFEEAALRLEGMGRVFQRARARIRETEVLILDEISMLPGRLLDFLNFWFQRQRHDERPWGGMQVIMVGDFLQLPPVRKDARPYDWSFLSDIWKSGKAVDKTVVLEQVRRQDEPELVEALQAARTGALVGRAARILQARVLENPEANRPRLMTHNAMVDKWCAYQLAELEGEEQVFLAVTVGQQMEVDSLEKNILAPRELQLKLGALVMNLVNADLPRADAPGEVFIANGQKGIVREFDEASNRIRIEFEFPNNEMAEAWVAPFTWSWPHNPPNKGGPSFAQFPLRLAYALTIHKSQGLTLDEAHIDIRAAREPGQAYVALSRVRTLDGLSLREWPQGIFVSPEAIEFYESLKPGYRFKSEARRNVMDALKKNRPNPKEEPQPDPRDELPGLEPDASFDDCKPSGSTGGVNPYERGPGSWAGKSNYTGD